MSIQASAAGNKESRHLWVGGLPDTIDETGIKEYFSRFGKVEGVKILPQKYPKIGVAAFIDFYDVKSAVEAKDAKHKLNGQELRTNFKAKQSEKFADSGGKKTSGDEQGEPSKRGDDPRSSSGQSDSDIDSDTKSSSDSDSESEKKSKKKKSGGEPFFLKITGLPRKPERVLQDGLYYEYTRHSPTVEIRMYGDDADKWAVAKFKKNDSCEQARQQTQGKNLFGNKIKVTAMDIIDFPDGGRDEPLVPVSGGGAHSIPVDDIDPQATRSLFVGNIPKNISVFDVRDTFQRYGNILDVEIKKMGGTATYGFVLYYDLMSAITAKKYMDGQNLKGNNIRVGFGKGTSSKQLWIDGIDSSISRQQLERHMNKHGKIVRLGIDYPRNCAMVQYDSLDSARKAVEAVRGTYMGGSRKLMTDFANRDARAAFFSHMERMEMVGVPQPYLDPSMYGPGMMEPGFRGGMMMSHPGMHMMGMGRGGFHPQGHGPPMDYMYDPFMEGGMGYYGGGRPPFHHSSRGHPVPVGMHPYPPGPGQFGDMDDYEEELAAYQRKRDWEKERDRKKTKKKKLTSSSESSSESDESTLHRKKQSLRNKHKKPDKKQKREKEKKTDDSDDDSDSEEIHDKVRLKATRKSKEYREKTKKRVPKESSSEVATDSEGECKVKDGGNDSRDEELKSKGSRHFSKMKHDKKIRDETGKSVSVSQKHSMRSESPSPASSVHSLEKDDKTRKSTKQMESKESDSSPQLSRPTEQAMEVKSGYVRQKDHLTSSEDGLSRKSSLGEAEVPTTVDTPQSPPPGNKLAKNKSSSVQVESDLSSGEEFKSCDNSDKISEENRSNKKYKNEGQSKLRSEQLVDNPPRRSQVSLSEDKLYRSSPGEAKTPSDGEQGERSSGRGVTRQSKHLPRRYQVEGELQDTSKKDLYRSREPIVEKRYMIGPASPSPPPSGLHRRRAYHTSPPSEQFERSRYRRSHPFSPGPPRGHRRHSRSPQRYQSPPVYKKTPSPRPQSPISRVKDVHTQRHRFDSSPSENPHGRFSRKRSPPSPVRRHQCSISPRYPRSPIRKRTRHHTPSLSPPRRSPVHIRKREKSPVIESGHSSPHYSNRQSKQAHHSRTPSPKAKYRESGKEDKIDGKRRRVEEPRPKTPPLNPLPPKGPSGQPTIQPFYIGGKQQQHTHMQANQAGTVVESQPQKNPGHLLVGAGTQAPKISVKTQAPSIDHGQQHTDNLLDLLRRYPVMWQGHLTLKNDSAAVQLHFLSGNVQLAKVSLPQPSEQHTPTLRIAQRMRLEKTQLEGVGRRMQTESEHCLLLALPCGRDASDVHIQTSALKNSLISYLIQKQAAGIINVSTPQSGYVLHIFPPCPFSQAHLSRVAPDLLSSASDNCHLMIVVATM